MVLVHLGLPTVATTAEKIAMIGLTNAQDVALLTSDIPNFNSDYAAAPTTNVALDAVAQTYATLLQDQLSTLGWQQFSTFVAGQQSNMNIYSINQDENAVGSNGTQQTATEATDYESITPINTGTPSSAFDATGQYEIEIVYGSCGSGEAFAPWIDYDDTDYDGDVRGTTEYVSEEIANNSTTPLTPSGEAGAGTIYQMTFWFKFTVVTGYPPYCFTSSDLVSETVQTEIAYTNVLETGAGYDCDNAQQGTLVCTYPVSPWCSNTNTPDYVPLGVNDTFHASWATLGACTRFGSSGPWGCISLVAVGSTATQRKPGCTYNP